MHMLRSADPADIDPLAQLWHDGWNEAHLAHVPAKLAAYRTLDSFRSRTIAFGDRLRTAGPLGAPLGLCAITNDELDQLYVSPAARGTGLAAELLAEGERRMARAGVTRAHLLCLIENKRAARFYERQGWENTGVKIDSLFTEDGPFELRVLRFEKDLRGG